MFLTNQVQPQRRLSLGSSHVLTPGLIAGFVAIIVVLIVARLVNTSNFRSVYRMSDDVAHTYALKGMLDGLLASLVDAETGERGFIITGNPIYLEPYNRAVGVIGPEIERIRELTAANSQQRTDLDQLQQLADRKIRELEQAVRLRREDGLAAAKAMVETNIGKRTMDSMRAIVARLEAREDEVLAARTIQDRQMYREALVTAYVSTGLELLLVGALLFATVRAGKDRLAAQDAAERLRVTLASIGDAIIVTDELGRVTRMNPVAESLTGWNEAEAIGRPAEEVFVIVNEDSRQPAENPIPRVLREGIVSGLANHTVLISRNGREIAIDDSAAPIKTADGRLTGVVMVFRDITERRRAEQERSALLRNERGAKADAERANRLKDEFLAVLSHELRTPLSSILGWAHVLNSRELPAERAQYAIQAILRSAQAEAQLVNSLLDLSRIMSGKLHLEMKALDLASIVNAAVDTVRPAAEGKSLTIDVLVPASPVVTTGDATRLEQVVWNLLSNAVKFTPERGRIQVRLTQAASHAEIEVSDNGIGIKPDFLPHVFDRFAQAESGTREAHVGLGLGLAIVRELVQGHGGTIRAASAGEGQGTTFTVTLPLRNVEI